jgi:pimeloyl-ACP methyl ester carboxylesterase
VESRLAVGVQAPYELIEAAGTKVAVARRGEGEPVLCLHATGHGARDFEHFVARVVPLGFEAVAVDWPGQGASPPDATGARPSASRYADILADLIPSLFQASAPIVLGNSIGGMAAIRFAAAHQDQVRALVLANPGGLAPLDNIARFAISALQRFFTAGARNARWFPFAFAVYYLIVLPSPAGAAQRKRIAAAGQEVAELVGHAWASFGHPESDLRRELERITCPILFAWAMQDRIVAWSKSARAVTNLRGSQVQRFRGGHAAFLEDPEAFVRAFVNFTQSLDYQPDRRVA